MDEGPLLMGHGPASLEIGATAIVSIRQIAGRPLIWCEPVPDHGTH